MLPIANEIRQSLCPGILRIYTRRVGKRHYDTLYAVWMERNGIRIADCIEACCATCAKADFIGKHFIVDEAEAELNRIYALEDKRPPTSVRGAAKRRPPGRGRSGKRRRSPPFENDGWLLGIWSQHTGGTHGNSQRIARGILD